MMKKNILIAAGEKDNLENERYPGDRDLKPIGLYREEIRKKGIPAGSTRTTLTVPVEPVVHG